MSKFRKVVQAGERAGLFDFLHASGALRHRFERWVAAVESLPTADASDDVANDHRVGFLARPDTRILFKPVVTRLAVEQ